MSNDLLRKALFVPCSSKEELGEWIKFYLDLDLPNCLVDEESTASSLDVIWEVYSACTDNSKREFARILAYASRDSYKTVLAAVLEVLMIVHLNRDVAHMAAEEQQAAKAAGYLEAYLHKPYLRDFITTDNKRRLEFCHYLNPETGVHISPKEFNSLSESQKLLHKQFRNYMQVVICSTKGANCIDPKTLITMADGSQKEAISVIAGDKVRSFDIGSHQYVDTEVEYVSSTRKRAMEIQFEDGGNVVLSEDHRIFTTGGWTTSCSLKIGDSVFRANEKVPDCVEPNLQIDFNSHWSSAGHNPTSVLLGTLLGDSSITWPKQNGKKYGKGPRFQCYHTDKQDTLLQKLSMALSELGIQSKTIKTVKKGGYGQDYTGNKLFSRVSENLVDLYSLVYPGDKKTVTQKLLNRIDAEALAWWLMNDGSGCPELVGSRKEKHISIATCGFGIEQNELIASWFRTRWGLRSAKVGFTSNQSKKRWPVIEFNIDDSRKLSEIVMPFFDSCVRYKLLAPTEAINAHCIDCGVLVQMKQRRGDRFARCNRHSPQLDRKKRMQQRNLKNKFSLKIKSLKYLPARILIDIHIKSDNPNLHNFVANSAILLHNSEHVLFMCVDEVDLANSKAYTEAKMIPAPRDGKLPITLLISTRKSSIGLVQKEIDEAPDSDLAIRHWNIIDVTEACPTSRHLPDEPRVSLYYSDEDLRCITLSKHALLEEKEQSRYKLKEDFYAGCAKCPLAAMCKGRLVTHQKSKSKLLKPITHTIELFKTLGKDINTAQAQLMCRKAAMTGLVYPRLSPELHKLTAAQMAAKMTGNEYPDSFSKQDLIILMKEMHVPVYAGLDWGYSHQYVVVSAAKWGGNRFIFDVLARTGLDPEQKLEATEYIKQWNPTIFADPEAADSIALFKKKGFRLKDWSKGKGSVLGGIDLVRSALRPTIGDPSLFFLKDDPQCEYAFFQMSRYHFEIDASGKVTMTPDEFGDDIPDGIRYLVMNTVANRGGVVVASETDSPVAVSAPPSKNHLGHFINQALNESPEEQNDDAPKIGRKGGFSWSF